MNDVDILSQIDRDKALFFLIENGIDVTDYCFEMFHQGKRRGYRLRHFGYIEEIEENQLWNFIDFLDDHFKNKRSAIVKYLIKRLNLQGDKNEK
jgi:hypothetical protein